MKTRSQKAISTSLFTVALFTTVKTWKQPKYPSTNEWIKEMWYISTMEYHSAGTKEEILPFATMWMDLEDIMFSEMSHTEEDRWCVVSLRCNKVQLPRETRETYLSGAPGLGK